jgi:hypothetical protein
MGGALLQPTTAAHGRCCPPSSDGGGRAAGVVGGRAVAIEVVDGWHIVKLLRVGHGHVAENDLCDWVGCGRSGIGFTLSTRADLRLL